MPGYRTAVGIDDAAGDGRLRLRFVGGWEVRAGPAAGGCRRAGQAARGATRSGARLIGQLLRMMVQETVAVDGTRMALEQKATSWSVPPEPPSEPSGGADISVCPKFSSAQDLAQTEMSVPLDLAPTEVSVSLGLSR